MIALFEAGVGHYYKTMLCWADSSCRINNEDPQIKYSMPQVPALNHKITVGLSGGLNSI